MIRYVALVCVLLTTPALSQSNHVFYEDFEDGNASDGTPLEWIPGTFSAGERRVNDGSFVVTSSEISSTVPRELLGTSVDDLSIFASMRFSVASGGSFAGIYGRSNQFDAYAALLDESGSLFLVRNSALGVEVLDSVALSLSPLQHDVSIRLDMIGDTISAKAWPSDKVEPLAYSVSGVEAEPLPPGALGLILSPNGLSTVEFREVYTLHVPEPGSGAALIVGLFGALAALRRNDLPARARITRR